MSNSNKNTSSKTAGRKVIHVDATRKNHRITKNKGRKQDTAKRTWVKKVEVLITGTDVDAIKETASHMYGLQNEHTKGGKDGRKVQILRIDSSDVETAFYGRH